MIKKFAYISSLIAICGITLLSNISVSATQKTNNIQKEDINFIIEEYLNIKDNNQLQNKHSKISNKLSYDDVFKNTNKELINFLTKRDELMANRSFEYDYSYEIVNRNIDIERVDISDGLIKAYISVSDELKYTVNGIEEKDLSYSTTNYIFKFDIDENGNLYIVDYESDDIEEMILKESDMDYVLEQDSLRIKNEKLELENVNYITEEKSERSINGSFNRTAMKNYAKNYYNSFNPNWGNFTSYGGDCTNFVSQILYAGGAPMDTTGSYTWYYNNMNDRAPAWTSVMHLYNYLVNNDYIGPQGKLANSSEILYSMNNCDIVQIDFNYDGTYDHSVVITSYQSGNSSSTKVAAHTSAAYDRLLSSYSGSKRYIKLTGYYK